MDNLMYINKTIYEDNFFVQKPDLCLPTCLAIIYEDLYNFLIYPVDLLKYGIAHKVLKFNPSTEEIKKYYIIKFGVHCEKDINRTGCSLNTGSLNDFFNLFHLSYKHRFIKNYDKLLNEKFYPSILKDENYATIDDIINKLESKSYILAFINYSKLIKEDSNEVNNHVVIVNKLFPKTKKIELLVPIEDEIINKVIVTEEQFRNSIINSKTYYGYSVIKIIDRKELNNA